MIKKIGILFFILFSASSFAQSNFNFELIGHKPYPDSCLSSIWGYTANNIEYALVGTCSGVSIVNISDPALPEVGFVPGAQSIWREIKTWQHYGYAVTEGGSGLTIFDMSQLPTGPVPYQHFQFTGMDSITNAHTIFIDENGICFLFGASAFPGGQGYVALDLNPNPMNPQFIGNFGNFYIHDAYVKDNIMYAGAILNGFAAILDLSNIQNPTVLSTVYTPGNFTHNAWINSQKSVMYTTDEVPSSFVTAYDISDPEFPVLLGGVRSSADSNSIPHNVHVVDDNWLAVSHYNKGVALIDAHKPDNMVFSGFFDTYPWNSDCCFVGAWGVYPYFNSNKWIISDMRTGLWVVKPYFKRAAYLEGSIRDAISNQPISNAKVHIQYQHFQDTARTYLDGSFKSGVGQGGQYLVSYSANGYISKSEILNFIPTFTITRNVKLLKELPLSTDEYKTQQIGLFPNPATNFIQIDIPENIHSYSIYSIDGRLMQKGKDKNPHIHGLQAGIYSILIYTDSKMYSGRFVKK